MNIVIFTDTFLPKIDGVVVSVENFTRILAKQGHNFMICCPRYGKDDVVQLGERIKIERFHNFALPSYPDIKIVLPSLKKIRRAMTMFPADVVHIQSPGLMGMYGAIAARYYGVPLIGTYHTLVSEQSMYLNPMRLLGIDRLINRYRKPTKRGTIGALKNVKTKKTWPQKIIQRMTNWFYEKHRIIISPSRRIRETLIEQGVQTPIEVISNGIDLTIFKGSIRPAPPVKPRLLHVGRISFEKNCDVVLRSFALLEKKLPGATLDIVGDGPALSSLKTMAKNSGIDNKVNFTGFIPRTKLPMLYPYYDLFITASTMETQGLVVLEAIASGLPCVGVDAYALPELIHHGRNGYLARPFDHEEMSRYALSILNEPSRYRFFSANSLKIASEHEINRCAAKLAQVYESLVRKAAAA